MITPFKLDPDVVSSYKTAQTVRSVMKRMGGLSNLGGLEYHGKTSEGGITEHRMREIQEVGNLGTSYTNATWYFKHHTTEAVSELDSHIEHWDVVSKHLGREDVFKRVEGFISRTRERILPACYAIHEADTNDQADRSYQDLCDRWIGRCCSQRQLYQGERRVVAQSQKRLLRKAETAIAKEILLGFKSDLSAWVNEVQAQIQ